MPEDGYGVSPSLILLIAILCLVQNIYNLPSSRVFSFLSNSTKSKMKRQLNFFFSLIESNTTSLTSNGIIITDTKLTTTVPLTATLVR